MATTLAVYGSLLSLPGHGSGTGKSVPAQWPSPGDFLRIYPQPTPDDFKQLIDIPLLETAERRNQGRSSVELA
jgi:hypothetical protein